MKFGIRTKFLLIISLLLFVIFGVITFSLIRSGTSALRRDLLDESEAFATLATAPIGNVFAIYKDSGTAKIDQEIAQFIELNESVTNIAIINVDGTYAYSLVDSINPEVSRDEASSFNPIYRNNKQGALDTIIYPYFEGSGAHRFSIVYSVSDKAIEASVRQEAVSLLYFGLGSLAVTLLLTYVLINRLIIMPIQRVSQQASVISAGNLEQQIMLRGSDEIASLGASVNKMAESLKADISKLKEVDKVKSEFMIITSHNLRTPLTIINGYLENMSLMTDPEKLKDALNKIGVSARRLDVFAEDILTISQFELGKADLQAEDTPITPFLKRLVEEFKPTANLKSLHVETDIPEMDIKVHISPPHLRSAIWNILDNAVKFTPEGGTITLDLSQSVNEVHFSVRDTGIGISAAEIPKLFTKFHRGTSVMNYDYEGTGIGLYSSKMIVENQGGSIAVSSTEGKGSLFTITLPIAGTGPSVPPKTE